MHACSIIFYYNVGATVGGTVLLPAKFTLTNSATNLLDVSSGTLSTRLPRSHLSLLRQFTLRVRTDRSVTIAWSDQSANFEVGACHFPSPPCACPTAVVNSCSTYQTMTPKDSCCWATRAAAIFASEGPWMYAPCVCSSYHAMMKVIKMMNLTHNDVNENIPPVRRAAGHHSLVAWPASAGACRVGPEGADYALQQQPSCCLLLPQPIIVSTELRTHLPEVVDFGGLCSLMLNHVNQRLELHLQN